MTGLSQQQLDAAHAFANATIGAFALPEGRVHPATVVAASARMAGTYLFRSFGLELRGIAPGRPVLSDAANEKGPALIQIAANALGRMGISLPASPPDAPADAKSTPMLPFLDTQRKLESAYAPIQSKFGLSNEQAAHAGALATALLIRHCAQFLDPALAFGIAVYGFVEGTKTVPAPPASQPA